MTTPDRAYLLRTVTRDLLVAGRLWRKVARRVAAAHGVSEAASAPLIWIDYLGDNVRQNAIAEAVGIEGASLVRLLDVLQEAGMVTRTVDPGDRRANMLSLTEQGRQTVASILDSLAELRDEVFADLATDDIAATMRLFDAIKAAAGKPLEPDPAP
ncbi:MAG: MarR family winged helix-turn-helix transcriptional regulator [Devosia sp.]